MHKLVWHWFRTAWRDVQAAGAARSPQREEGQLERSCREHGMLWLIDQTYADGCPATVAIQRRRKATR